MSFSGNYLCSSFKLQLLQGVHNFAQGGHVFRLALYTPDAVLTALTTAYSATDEIAPTGDYAAGGVTLTQTAPALSGTTALVTFASVTVTGGTFVTQGGLIYNSSVGGNPAVAVLDFGLPRRSNGGAFAITFPAATPTDALIRIA